jgi:predicted molibdopterin-dependent oxidoreductase YjgC
VGGYPAPDWPAKDLVAAVGGLELLIVQDLFPNKLNETADVLLPSCAWVEREGSFMNHEGRVQPFERAVPPLEGAQADGQYLYAIAGHAGLYTADRVREMMVGVAPALTRLWIPPVKPKHQH